MAITLLAASCPSIQQPASMLSISGAGSGSGNALVAKNMASGDSSFRTTASNPNATILDRLASEGGANAFAVSSDFPPVLSTGGTLNLAVSAGEAMIGGPVQYAGGTVTVPDNTARVWIWMSNASVLTAVATSTTPPAGRQVLLGSCTTASGAVTAVDTSGVLYLKGGTLWRQTADVLIPADTPPSTVQFLALTNAGPWWWDGTAYRPIGSLLGARYDTLAAGQSDYIRLGQQANINDKLTNAGTITVAGKLRVV